MPPRSRHCRPGWHAACAKQLLAAAVGGIAGADVGAISRVLVGARHEAAAVGAFAVQRVHRADVARGGIDRRRVAGHVEPAVEIVPAERVRHGLAIRIVALQAEVKLSEQSTLVPGLLEQLGHRHLIGRDLRIGQVLRAERAVDPRAQREASGIEHRPAGRAGRHRPGVAEADARVGQLVDRRRLRRVDAAVAELAHLVDADVVHDDEQDVRSLLLVLRLGTGLRTDAEHAQREQDQPGGDVPPCRTSRHGSQRLMCNGCSCSCEGLGHAGLRCRCSIGNGVENGRSALACCTQRWRHRMGGP